VFYLLNEANALIVTYVIILIEFSHTRTSLLLNVVLIIEMLT